MCNIQCDYPTHNLNMWDEAIEIELTTLYVGNQNLKISNEFIYEMCKTWS